MSFTNSSGGTLALPSPTHAHHLDVTSAVRKLRRELSRSPSKFLTHAAPQTSHRPQHDAPTSPSPRLTTAPEQPHLPASLAQPAFSATPLSPNTERLLPSAFTPQRSSVKLSLRSAKSVKTASPSFRPPARPRPSPRSPLKRALSTASDSGNAAPSFSPSPSSRSSPGQENRRRNTSPLSPEEIAEKPVRHSVHLDVSGAATQYSFLKALEPDGKACRHPVAGALKRSDATMNLDYPNRGSLVAKRRSLHGISGLGQLDDMLSFSNHGLETSSFDIHDESHPDELDSTGTSTSPPQADLASQQPDGTAPLTHAANMHERFSSLRKSTLQQRCGDKISWGRRTGERQLAQMSAEPSSPARVRPRLSTDHFLPPPPSRDSPFAPSKPMHWAALPSIDGKGQQHQPHPLSRTLTTSTSGNSLTEETGSDAPPPRLPSFPPPHTGAAETKQPSYPFSRSLPLNAARPSARPLFDRPQALTTPSRSHQLWIGAFESTGLISKVNRNFDDDMEQKLAPPDTPCKKHTNPFATFPPPTESVMKRKTSSRNSFAGLPSTPFNRSVRRAPESFGAPGRGLAIFQRGSLPNHARRGSILGREGDDRALFGELGSLSVRRNVDLPPTPTRHLLTPSLSNLSEQSLESPSAYRSLTLTLPAPKQAISRKPAAGESSDDARPRAAAAARPCEILGSCPLLSLSQERGVELSPTPSLSLLDSSDCSSPLPEGGPDGSLHATDPSSVSSLVSEHAKPAPADSDLLAESHKTPQTPQEGLLSLDANRLSISQVPDSCGGGMPPPVTPTADRDFRSSTNLFVTPVNGRMSDVDIDPSLYSRFDAIEQVGKGQFSSVYRVKKVEHSAATSEVTGAAPSLGAVPTTTSRSQVFAVKKSRHSYHGRKDRDIKLREVQVLRALRHAEHVVQFVDSWEDNFHLYIQTEFCEEGTLARFLGKIGRSGRLDDFRIFKILQDLCLGVKEIHDAGFMHLDLKPANVFIHFDGSLKIGDFGLAQRWSGNEGVDVEGDREYMAPEMLTGRATPAADIFSLGLIALEVAANVILPDNGPTWVALRSGDLTEIPSLTWSPSLDIPRDADGNPSSLAGELLDEEADNPSSLFESSKRLELQDPPEFMYRGNHASSLDSIVRWMTAELPDHRPFIDQVLALEGMQWIAEHREAPATVYEGNWGPAVDFSTWNLDYDSDAEMLDV